MQKIASDAEIKKKGLKVLFGTLGEADAIRFLSQISYEKRDYLKLQDMLFEGMNVDDIYRKAQEYLMKRKNAKKYKKG
jgi:hypothetical protein